MKAALSANLDRLKPHELPRFAILAPQGRQAIATFRLLVGALRASSALSKMLDRGRNPAKGFGTPFPTIPDDLFADIVGEHGEASQRSAASPAARGSCQRILADT